MRKNNLFWSAETRLNTRVTEDEKVSTDELQEKIQEFEDYVQSTDIAAMQSTSNWLAIVVALIDFDYHDRTLKRDHGDVFE